MYSMLENLFAGGVKFYQGPNLWVVAGNLLVVSVDFGVIGK